MRHVSQEFAGVLMAVGLLFAAAAPVTAVVAGTDADIADYPYQIALIRKSTGDSMAGQFCGGSLIAPSWVVTAAHCVNEGDWDPEFGTTGGLRAALSSANDVATSVALQPDGRVLVAGTVHVAGSGDVVAVLRLMPDGVVDSSFSGGMVATDIGVGLKQAASIAVQPDDGILVAATSNDGGVDGIVVIRYLADGTLDTSFGPSGTGRASATFAGLNARAASVALQSDGRILVAGDLGSGSGRDFLVVRFLSDGTLDPSFGSGGVASGGFGDADDEGRAIVVQPDGKIVVAGRSTGAAAGSDIGLLRFDGDGILDAAFGTGGGVTTDLGITTDQGWAVALQTDGRILVVDSRSSAPSGNDFTVVRYLSDGDLDTGFGDGGVATTAVGDGESSARAVAVQPDGKIVLAGYARRGASHGVTLVRLLTTGAIDSRFGSDGVVNGSNKFGGDHRADAVVIQPDGKIVTVGSLAVDGVTDTWVTRYVPDWMPPGLLDVGVGRSRLSDLGASDIYGVALVHPHPYYAEVGSSSGLWVNDIALLELTEPVPSTVASPIMPADEPGSPTVGTLITATGWGSTDTRVGPQPDTLQVGTVSALKDSDWRCALPGETIDAPRRICAGDPDWAGSWVVIPTRMGICQGDSGGPGVAELDGSRYLVGVASYNLFSGIPDPDQCGWSGSIFTRVSSHINWIRSIVPLDGASPEVESSTPAQAPGVTPLARARFDACPAVAGIPDGGFDDTDSSDVDCIAYYGITRGTTETTYSPDDPVSRWQMALYLTRTAGPAGVNLGMGEGGPFIDISAKSAEIRTAINQIRELGITVGKTATTFAPDADVTRQEMALFIQRFLSNATAGPGGVHDLLVDDDGQRSSGVGVAGSATDVTLTLVNYTDIDTGTTDEGRSAIAHLWHMGVTSDGCSTETCYATVYRPNAAMTRAEMAGFMAGALDHTNARPRGVTLQAAVYDVAGEVAVTWVDETTPTLSASYRAENFTWSAGNLIDVFRYQASTTAGEVDFTASGACSTGAGGPVAATASGTVCRVDAGDQATGALGNTTPVVGSVPSGRTWIVYAWTAPAGTAYDNDLHLADASRLELTVS